MTKFILRISLGQGTSGWLDCQPHSAYLRFCNKLQDRNSILILPLLILQLWAQTQKYCIMYQLSSSSLPHAFSNSKFSGKAYVLLTSGTGHLRYTCISMAKPCAILQQAGLYVQVPVPLWTMYWKQGKLKLFHTILEL